MNTKNIIRQLKRIYPNKTIIENKNNRGATTEIICETDPTELHPSHSTAIAIIDSSTIHYHKIITETYKVLKGKLTIFKYDSEKRVYDEYTLNKGKAITIKPGEIHSNKGNTTWVEVLSKPGWVIGDYYNLEIILKKYLKRDNV